MTDSASGAERFEIFGVDPATGFEVLQHMHDRRPDLADTIARSTPVHSAVTVPDGLRHCVPDLIEAVEGLIQAGVLPSYQHVCALERDRGQILLTFTWLISHEHLNGEVDAEQPAPVLLRAFALRLRKRFNAFLLQVAQDVHRQLTERLTLRAMNN